MNYFYTRLPHDGKQGKIRLGVQGVQIDRQYIDKPSSKHRPQLNALLAEAKGGDNVYVETIGRFAYDMDDFRDLTEKFRAKGAILNFVRISIPVVRGGVQRQAFILPDLSGFQSLISRIANKPKTNTTQ